MNGPAGAARVLAPSRPRRSALVRRGNPGLMLTLGAVLPSLLVLASWAVVPRWAVLVWRLVLTRLSRLMTLTHRRLPRTRLA
jgi:hypothetical protein